MGIQRRNQNLLKSVEVLEYALKKLKSSYPDV